jgi:ABC-2 type transport system permease protein
MNAVAPPTSSHSHRDVAVADRPWLVVGTLCRRELVRFFRQRNRVVGAIGQPILFWLLFGAGLGPSFRLPGTATDGGAPGISYREFFFPGTMSLILLFTAIFTTISIIEDRREGFLQSVLVAPISRWSMVLGKLLGGTLIALVQALVFFALGATLDLHYSPTMIAAVTAFSFLSAFALTALGFVIAWRMDSTQGFHAVMSVFLMPMWLLSGSFFPGEGWLRWVMAANPMTYMTAGLRQLLYLGSERAALLPPHLPNLATCWGVTFAFAALLFVIACRMAAGRTTGDLL